ncbi:hypothetical protein STANM309S_04423 [Streptomyces tanashiensis]
MTSAIPPNAPDAPAPGPQVRATTLVRHARLWLVPTVLCALVSLLLSLLYMGGILSPGDHLNRLPIALVDEDEGRPLPGQSENLGKQITDAIASTGSSKTTVDWRRLDRAEAQDALDSGKVFGALVVPADFTASVAALTTDRATARPTLTVLTNPASAAWASLASQINQGAAHQASRHAQLSASSAVRPPAAARRPGRGPTASASFGPIAGSSGSGFQSIPNSLRHWPTSLRSARARVLVCSVVGRYASMGRVQVDGSAAEPAVAVAAAGAASPACPVEHPVRARAVTANAAPVRRILSRLLVIGGRFLT